MVIAPSGAGIKPGIKPGGGGIVDDDFIGGGGGIFIDGGGGGQGGGFGASTGLFCCASLTVRR